MDVTVLEKNHIMDVRDQNVLKQEKYNDDKVPTGTSLEQIITEKTIEKCFERFQQLRTLNPSLLDIYREQHIRYLENSLQQLSNTYECLDSSRPWLIYWILNAAHCLNFKFREDLLDRTINFLIKCRDARGGFGGGPGQEAHLAPTYAAVNSLCIIGSEKAYEAINVKTLKNFLWSVREPDGSFCLHMGGETDVRGAYCALSCAKLCNFPKKDEDALFNGTADWIASCQTYEGGFGGAPDLEAHGGYTFCGISALVMLGQEDKCNLNLLLRWAVSRQMRYEGGFQGRTNKLVDGCYSFWVGAVIPIVQAVLAKQNPIFEFTQKPVFDQLALQEYILLCCQRTTGGLLDKPGKPPDLYHTCYALSGVSISQHCELNMEPLILGPSTNELQPVHPLHNVPPLAVLNIFKYFKTSNDDDQSNCSQKSEKTEPGPNHNCEENTGEGECNSEEEFTWNTTSS